MKRKVAACYLKKGMAYCLMGAMLLGLSIGTAGCGKEQKGTQEAEGNTEIQEVEGNDGPIEIVYWNQWTQEDETAFLKKYVEEYNSSQDKYHVSFLAIPYEEYTTTKLATAFATNEAPDIFECSPAIINQYLDAGVCEVQHRKNHQKEHSLPAYRSHPKTSPVSVPLKSPESDR